MKSMVTNSPADFRLAIQHFYKGGGGPVAIAKRTIIDGAPLKELRPAFGAGGLIVLVSALIERFNGLFNFAPGKKLSAAQVEDLAAEIVLGLLDVHFHKPVTFEEIAVFFDRASRNEFVKDGRPFIFDRIDKSIVLAMLDFYFEDKENGRTAAAWQLENEKDEKDRQRYEEISSVKRLTAGEDAQPFDIEKFTEGRSHLTAKGLKELHEKYGK